MERWPLSDAVSITKGRAGLQLGSDREQHKRSARAVVGVAISYHATCLYPLQIPIVPTSGRSAFVLGYTVFPIPHLLGH